MAPQPLRENRVEMSEEGMASASTAPRARRLALGLGPERLLTMYRQMLLARALDQRAWALNRQGEAPFVISGQGHEGAQVGAAAALRPGVDWVVPYYRDLALCLAMGMTAREFMLSVLARADDPSSGGRQMPSHFSLRRARIVTISSTVATQVVHAAGIAYASQLRGLDEVTITTLGEGSTSSGDWHEALNFAGVHRLPLICLVEDNSYAISVPRRLQMPIASVAERAHGYDMVGADVDGSDPLAVYEAVSQAVQRARAGEGPTLIRARCTRLTSHSSDDDQRRYRPAEELEEARCSDPIDRFRAYLREEGLLTEEAEGQLQRECGEEVEAAVEAARAAPLPDPGDLERHVYAEG